MTTLGDDARLSFRRLVRSPGFTGTALLTLALGIGANTALFSVVYAVLLRPLPFPEPERLHWIWSRHTSTDRYPFQLPEFCDYRDQNQTLEALAGFANWNASLTGDGAAERLAGLRVSGDFFGMLGAVPALGRTLGPDDDLPGHEKVVVLTHGLWQRRFGGDAKIVGRRLLLNGEPFSVVGVLGRDFLFPVRAVEMAVPLAPDQDPWRHNRDSTNFVRALGRAKKGVTAPQLAADLESVGRRLRAEFPKSYVRKTGVLVRPYRDELTRGVSQTLLILLAAVALLLLIACANLANLSLVRAVERRREMAVRRALGAKAGQLVRQLVVESALLALAGAALGLLLARWAVPGLVALSPDAMPRSAEVGISLPVLAFTMGAATLCGVLFGLAPALRAAREDPDRDLRADGRGATGGLDRARSRSAIVMAQVALMTVLLTGAALLAQSFDAVTRVHFGFDTGLLTVRLSLPRPEYKDLAKISGFYRDLEARVAGLPGVLAVAAVNHVPLNGALASADYKVAGRPPLRDDQLPTAQYRMVTPAYFRAMGIPLVAGRAFDEEDREGGAPVAIVSQALARQSFPEENPVGQHLLVQDTTAGFRSLEVVGVVGDVKHLSLESGAEPHLYVSYHQTPADLLVWLTLNQFLVVKTVGPPLALGDPVRREVAAIDANVATADARPSGYYVENAMASRRFGLVLVSLFAALGLAMAAIGIYGVVAYSVAQRRRETGVRLALGAGTSDILGLVLKEGLRRTLIGVGAGLGAAAASTRALGSLLYGVSATEPLAYAVAAALLMSVTLLACLLPAWRAARSSPLEALRHE